MFSLSKLERHESLVSGMADRRGVDFSEAMLRGELSGNELRSAIFRCTACSDPDGCEQWQQEHSAGAAETPGYCRNASLFSRLSA